MGNSIGNEGKEICHTVKNVDLNRFMGKWYRIASLINEFESNESYDVTVEYSMGVNNEIKISTEEFIGDKKIKSISHAIPIHWKKSSCYGSQFNLKPDFKRHESEIRFYFILDLDRTNYEHAVVGSQDWLWIINRKPQMDAYDYGLLLHKLKMRFKNFYNIQDIEVTSQNYINFKT